MSSTTRTSPAMNLPGSPFNPTDVVTCANLVEVAYAQYCQWEQQGKPTNPGDFTWKPVWPSGFNFASVSAAIWGTSKVIFFTHPEPFGFVVQDSAGRTFLVFRGTESDANWYKNLEVKQAPYGLAPNFGNVHQGFFDVYSSMSPTVLAAINQVASSTTAFFFTGHSLGSALVTLAVPDVMLNSDMKSSSATFMHYNFASPRAGDETFSSAINAIANLPSFRIVNTEDVVPDVPPAVTSDISKTWYYKHIGMPVDFTAQYDGLGANHSMLNSYLYAVNNPTQPEGPIVAASSCQPTMPAALLTAEPTW